MLVLFGLLLFTMEYTLDSYSCHNSNIQSPNPIALSYSLTLFRLIPVYFDFISIPFVRMFQMERIVKVKNIRHIYTVYCLNVFKNVH